MRVVKKVSIHKPRLYRWAQSYYLYSLTRCLQYSRRQLAGPCGCGADPHDVEFGVADALAASAFVALRNISEVNIAHPSPRTAPKYCIDHYQQTTYASLSLVYPPTIKMLLDEDPATV